MRVLIGEIVSGERSVGEQLPRETDIAQQFGVSRGVARETLRSLEERGLVTVRHGRAGATVNPEQRWDVFDPDVLEAILSGPDGVGFLHDYLECRQILEVEAAGLAAERGTDEAIAALAEAFERMKSSAERARVTSAGEDLYRDADIAFHRAVVDATQNRALGQMTEPLHRALSAALRPLARPEHRFDRALPEHERILLAIQERDPAAAREAMQKHLATVAEYLEEYTAPDTAVA